VLNGDPRIEVFASPRAKDVRERELVLRAKGVPYQRVQTGGLFALYVQSAHADVALRELADYETENVDWPPKEVVPPALPFARTGTYGFLFLVGGMYVVTSANLFGLDWSSAGASHAESVFGGEPWRAVTALFLHTGPVHVLSNMIFGALFGFSVAYTLGGGLGWFAILLAGVLGNLTNALVVDPSHVSVGASTAVFGAVGLLGGTEWRRRHLLRQRRLRRAAPIVMVLLLLAFHGIPEVPGRVDVGAHVMGLVWGIVLGALAPNLLAHGWGERRGQVLAAILALALVALAWTLALTTS